MDSQRRQQRQSQSITAPPGGPTSSSTTFSSATSSSSSSSSSALAPVAYSSSVPQQAAVITQPAATATLGVLQAHERAHSSTPSPTRATEELRQQSGNDSDAEHEDSSPSFSLSSASNAADRENLSDREEQQHAASEEPSGVPVSSQQEHEEADETQPLLGGDGHREGVQWVDQDPKEVEDEAKITEKTADILNMQNAHTTTDASSAAAAASAAAIPAGPAPVFKSKMAYFLRRCQRSDTFIIFLMFYGMVCGLMMYGTIATVMPFMDEFDYVANVNNDDSDDFVNVDDVSSAVTSAKVAETLALMGVGQILGSFLLGPLCDIPAIGRRGMFVASQCALCAAIMLFFCVSNSSRAYWDILRLGQGIAAGAQEVSAQAVFLDLFANRPDMIPIVFGVINMGLTVGYVSGPPLGGYMWQLYGRWALVGLFLATYILDILARIICVDDDYLTCVRTGLITPGELTDITPEMLQQAHAVEKRGRESQAQVQAQAEAAESAAAAAASGAQPSASGEVVVGISTTASAASSSQPASAPAEQPGCLSRIGAWIMNYLRAHYSLFPKLFGDIRFSVVLLSSGVAATNTALYDSIIPSYAKHSFAMGSGMAGVITFLIVFPSILFALPAGMIASRVRKLPLALIVIIMLALFSWLPVFTPNNLYGIVGLLAAANFFSAFIRPALGAYVVRVVISHGFSNALGQFAAINYCFASIFMSLVPFVGGEIYKATNNFAMMLYLLAGIGVIMAALVLYVALFSKTGWNDPGASLADSVKTNTATAGQLLNSKQNLSIPTVDKAGVDVSSKA